MTSNDTAPRSIVLKKYVIGESKMEFCIPSYYVPKRFISRGAYGVVIAAEDTRSGKQVAIKKMSKVFQNDKEYQKRILREILLLRHFSSHLHHENLINLLDLCMPPSYDAFNDVLIVNELMDADIRSVIRSKQSLTIENIQYFLYQVLRGLKYIHSADVVHRDLKPANILINADLEVKICDFGLSRSLNFEGEKPDLAPAMSTSYVATRWYRSPELLTMWPHASKALDLWSVGCIMAEMLDSPPKRRVLFPGKHHLDQLNKILDFLGTPQEEDIRACAKARVYMKTLKKREKQSFADRFPQAPPEAIDLLQGLLQFNPEKRLTVDQALQHEFFTLMHDPDDEPTCPKGNFDNFDNLDDMDLKKMMYDIIAEWNDNAEVTVENPDDPVEI